MNISWRRAIAVAALVGLTVGVQTASADPLQPDFRAQAEAQPSSSFTFQVQEGDTDHIIYCTSYIFAPFQWGSPDTSLNNQVVGSSLTDCTDVVETLVVYICIQDDQGISEVWRDIDCKPRRYAYTDITWDSDDAWCLTPYEFGPHYYRTKVDLMTVHDGNLEQFGSWYSPVSLLKCLH